MSPSRRSRPIRVFFGRHSIKKKGTKTGLSRPGINAAIRAGHAMGLKGYKMAGRHSPVARAQNTLRYQLGGFHRTGGKTYTHSRSRKTLDVMKGYANAAAEAPVDKMVAERGEPQFLRDWLDGKISTRLLRPAFQVADEIIRDELSFGKFIRDWRNAAGPQKTKAAWDHRKPLAIRNIGHSWYVEVVFERLTGRKFDQTRPRNKVVRVNEGLELRFFPRGKIVLNYRGKNYDVTKKFIQIAGA